MNRPVIYCWLQAAVLAFLMTDARSQNRVLEIDGEGGFVQLPVEKFAALEAATVEAWVKWDEWRPLNEPFSFGQPWRCLAVNVGHDHMRPQFLIYESPEKLHLIKSEVRLRLERWYHLAAVSGPQGMKLYVDGHLVGEHAFTGSFAAVADPDGTDRHQVGGRLWEQNALFKGQVDQVRVWEGERSAEEIALSMHSPRLGGATRLLGEWDFEDGGVPGGAVSGEVTFPESVLPNASACLQRLEGVVTDREANFAEGVRVELRRGTRTLQETQTDASGRYHFWIHGDDGPVDVVARHENDGAILQAVTAQGVADLQLAPGAMISGRVNDVTGEGQEAAVVTARRGSEILGWALTDVSGSYRLFLPLSGNFDIVCHGSRTSVTVKLGDAIGQIDFELKNQHRGHWRKFDVFDGLGGNNISAIHESSDGHLWFGTHGGGLARYDRGNFITVKRNDGRHWNHVHCISEDANKHLWIGTSHGYSRYDGEQFHDVPGTWVRSIAHQADGTPVIYKLKGIHALQKDGDSRTMLDLPHKHALGALLRDGEYLWAGAIDQGLHRFDMNGGREHFTLDDGLPNMTVRALALAPDGTLWGGTDRGLFHFDGSTFRTFGPEDGIAATATVTSLFVDPDDSLWFGTLNGLGHYDGRQATRVGRKQGLAHPVINAVHRDREGILWVATQEGLSRYDDQSTETFNLAAPLLLQAEMDAQGHLWIGTPEGIYRYDGETWAEPNAFPEVGALRVLSISRQGSDLWVATGNGDLFQHEDTGFKSVRNQFPYASAFYETDVSAGARWLFGPGVLRYSSETGALKSLKGLEEIRPCSAVTGDGRGFVWIGTLRDGVFVYDEKNDVVVKQITQLPNIDTLRIKDIHVSADGTVWIAAEGGLSRLTTNDEILTKESLALENWQTYTQEQGDAFASISEITETEDGILWFANGAGVSQFDGFAWSFLDTRDGLLGNRTIDVCQGPQGDLWIAFAYSGVTRYRRHLKPPQVRVASLQIGLETIDLEDTPRILEGAPVSIICETTDEHTLPGKQQLRYRFRSVGQDKHAETSHPHWRGDEEAQGWIGPVTASRISWSPESLGEQVLEVQAINRDLQYSAVAAFPFRVVLPWYRNPWFLVPLGFVLLALVGSLLAYANRYYSQRRETHRKQAELLKLTSDKNEILNIVAHDLRTPLWTSMNFAELLLKHPDMERPKSEKIAGDILSGSQRMMTLVERLLDVHAIESGDIQSSLTDCDLAKITREVIDTHQANAEAKSLTLLLEGEPSSPAKADSLLVSRVLDNLLSNAIKFSPHGKTIRVIVDPHQIRVADEGPGFTEADRQQLFQKFTRFSSKPTGDEPSMGLGLFAAKRLAEMMGGSLSLEPSEIGATFLLELRTR